MRLFGTTTSPFVRRVRVFAEELGEPIERTDTASEAGLAALREVTPIAKVPVVVVDGRLLFDSRVIIDWLVTTRGWHGLVPPRDPWRTNNIVHAIDEALGSIVQVFYLRRDGVAIDGNAFGKRQLERADAIFAWLGTQLQPDAKSFDGGLGLAEISLVATLDWMDFRKTYPTERAPALAGLRDAWREHPSLVATRPAA